MPEIKSTLRTGNIEVEYDILEAKSYVLIGSDETCQLIKCLKTGNLIIKTNNLNYIQLDSQSVFNYAEKLKDTHPKSYEKDGKNYTTMTLRWHIANQGTDRNSWYGMTFGKKPQFHVMLPNRPTHSYKKIDVNRLIETLLKKHYTKQPEVKQTEIL